LKVETQRSFEHKMVELKARVDDHEFLRKKLSALGAEYTGTFQQSDLYFKVPEGRLKLREVENNGTVELIYYERENIAGPKSDDREIYQYQGTQIHLDTVKKLGKFIEFERQTADDSSMVEKDQSILEKLMETLEIDSSNLEKLSYSDLAEA